MGGPPVTTRVRCQWWNLSCVEGVGSASLCDSVARVCGVYVWCGGVAYVFL